MLIGAAPAHAGILSALSALSKVGRVAGKAGQAAKVTKVAKGAALWKGAGTLTAAVAAERVLAHAATSGHRVPLFVTRADDGLRVVMAGDELPHTAASLRALTDDLDRMAAAQRDAGVDLYLDASVVDELATLGADGAHTRVWLANIDGPSVPLRARPDGPPQVAVARHTWVDWGTHLGDLALQVTTSVPDLVVSVSGPCADGAPFDDAQPGQTVFVVADPAEAAAWAAWRADATERGIDLVVLGLDGVCDGAVPSSAAEAALEGARRAATVGDLWTLLDAPTPQLRLDGTTLHLQAGDRAWAVHPALVESSTVGPPDDVLAMWIGAGAVGLLVVAVGVARVRSVRATRSG